MEENRYFDAGVVRAASGVDIEKRAVELVGEPGAAGGRGPRRRAAGGQHPSGLPVLGALACMGLRLIGLWYGVTLSMPAARRGDVVAAIGAEGSAVRANQRRKGAAAGALLRQLHLQTVQQRLQ